MAAKNCNPVKSIDKKRQKTPRTNGATAPRSTRLCAKVSSSARHPCLSLGIIRPSVQYCTDICAGKFYNYPIELHTFRLCFFL